LKFAFCEHTLAVGALTSVQDGTHWLAMPCRDCLDRQLAPLCLLRLEPTLASACLAMPCRDCLDRQLFEQRMEPTSSIETALSCAANQCCPLFRGYRDCLDRQLFEERMLEVGREVARNEFPDVILLQASLWPAFMLLLL